MGRGAVAQGKGMPLESLDTQHRVPGPNPGRTGAGLCWGLLVRCHLSMGLRGWGRLRLCWLGLLDTQVLTWELWGEGVPSTPSRVCLIQRGVELSSGRRGNYGWRPRCTMRDAGFGTNTRAAQRSLKSYPLSPRSQWGRDIPQSRPGRGLLRDADSQGRGSRKGGAGAH